MHWTIAAPFVDRQNVDYATWLEPYVPGDRHQFTLIPREVPLESWHDRKSKFTRFKEWLVYWRQGMDAIRATEGGVITVFPQAAAVVGMQQQLQVGRHVPVVAWLFNVGTCHEGWRRQFSKLSLQQIDRFVVHTRREREIYSEWLGLPIERFEFVPYQVPDIPVTYEEETKQPFIAALGSAHRDFPTLFQAVEKLNLPTVVASGKTALEGLTIPAQVQTPFGIKKADCLKLAQQARINVVPLVPNEKVTAAGQVTIVEAMRMGRAVIATRCNGVEDYIIDGETGLIIEPHSVTALMEAIEKLWNDEALRNRLGKAAQQYAAAHFSDEAAGQALGRILDSVADTQLADSFVPNINAPKVSYR
jgi:glycosyltransferase involved in cell wall biosynthesis